MTPTATSQPSRSTTGIALMVVAMLTLPGCDAIAKHLTATHSPFFLAWARCVAASAMILPLAVSLHGIRVFPATRQRSHLLRTLFLMTSMTLFFSALERIPLALAISTYLVSPILAAGLSIPLLRERMTGRKALGLVLGFGGSLVILQPGGSLDPGVLLALGAGISFAFYIIATRHAAQGADPVQAMTFQVVVGAMMLTPQALWTWSVPAWNEVPFFAGLGAISVFSHLLSVTAFRLAEATTLAPLFYVELVGAVLLGYLAFGEVPRPTTVLGGGLIVLAGLILIQRTRGAAIKGAS